MDESKAQSMETSNFFHDKGFIYSVNQLLINDILSNSFLDRNQLPTIRKTLLMTGAILSFPWETSDENSRRSITI